MITLDQIQLLEKKVSEAVQLIKTLRKENEELHEEKKLFEKKIAELESRESDLASNQGMIEKGIMDALNQFDELEESGLSTQKAEEDHSETISASEDTEIAQSPSSLEEQAIPEDREYNSGHQENSDGNQSEQPEIESEDPQDEAPAEEETQAAVESSVEDVQEETAFEESIKEENLEEKDSEEGESPIEDSNAEETKNSGYPQNLEIF